MIAIGQSGREKNAAVRRGRGEALVIGLTAAALIELVVLRTFTRTAIHVPAIEQLAGPYTVISWLGRYAYYVAAVLLVVALPVAATALWERRDLPSRAAAASVGFFAVVALATRAGAVDSVTLDALSVGAVVLAASAATAKMERRAGVVLATFTLAFALSGGYTMLQDAAAQGISSFDGRWLLAGAEVMALVFAIAVPFGLRARPGPWVLAVSAAVAIGFFGMLLGNPATFKILLLWNEGLSGVYPALAYAVAIGALWAAGAGLVRQGRMLAAAGLLLLLFGGIGLHSTYQTGLVVIGFAALCLAAGERPRNPR